MDDFGISIMCSPAPQKSAGKIISKNEIYFMGDL